MLLVKTDKAAARSPQDNYKMCPILDILAPSRTHAGTDC